MYWIGVALWCVVGGEFGAVARGASQLGDGSGVAQFVVGINLVPWTALVAWGLLRAGNRKRLGLDAKGPSERALARVESSRAVSEGPDHLLRLDLTVAPEGRPAYRSEAHARVNVMDLERFQAAQTVVVDLDVEHPWRVAVLTQPDGAWAGRVALARIDSAPEATRRVRPPEPRTRARWYGLLATAVGLTVYLLLL